jgi:hypothetical protein
LQEMLGPLLHQGRHHTCECDKTKLRLETARAPGAESRAEIQVTVRNINGSRIVLLPEKNEGQTGFCEGVSPTAQLPT